MVPMFKKIYIGLSYELCWLTRVLLNLSDSLRIHPGSLILGTLIWGTLLVAIYRTLGVFVVAEADSRWKEFTGKCAYAVLQQRQGNHAQQRRSPAGGC